MDQKLKRKVEKIYKKNNYKIIYNKKKFKLLFIPTNSKKNYLKKVVF